jgi:hypothetical protein
MEAIMPGQGLSGWGPAVGFPARSSSPMPYGSSRAEGDVGVAPAGLRIVRAMQPSAARGETSGPRPKRYDARAGIELAPGLCRLLLVWKTGRLAAEHELSAGVVRG